MADVKISGLPASSVPLAGTEVLPIVQGGQTRQVSVNNLTTGKAVSATQYTSTIATGTAPLVVASTTEVANLRSANATSADTANQVKSNATSGVLQITGPAAAATRVMTTPDANFSAARIDAAQTFTGVQTFSSEIITKVGTATDPAIYPTGDTNTGIFFPAADTIAFTEGGAESMRIDSSGNLGVGTVSPTSRVHVSGSGAITQIQTTDNAVFPSFRLLGSGGGQNAVISTVSGTGGITFAGTTTELMRIHNSGGVSIGNTTDPGAGSLRVNSTFRYGSMFIIHGSNLNTITQCGDYAGYGLTNGPAFVNPAAWLLVEVFNTNDSIIWQRCTDAPFASNAIKNRGSADGGATWTAWV
jgi:hypothetical protein